MIEIWEECAWFKIKSKNHESSKDDTRKVDFLTLEY